MKISKYLERLCQYYRFIEDMAMTPHDKLTYSFDCPY